MNILEKYRVILWDFDGVIIDSNEVRELGFTESLSEFSSQQVEQLLEYHRINGGLSRYNKFRYFFEEILGETVTEKVVQDFARKFSQVVLNRLINPSLLLSDSIAFISEFHSRIQMHVVSGSDGEELRQICSALGISKYFRSINGSPTPKIELVSNLLQSYELEASDVCLIGDSINDYEAAIENGIQFYGYNNSELKGSHGEYITSFDALYGHER